MRIKEIEKAENVKGAKMIVDVCPIEDKQLFCELLELYGAMHSSIEEDGKIIAFLEDTCDCERTWNLLKSKRNIKFKYRVETGIPLIEVVPNFKKLWEFINDFDHDDDAPTKRYNKERASIYDTIVSSRYYY